MASDGASPFAVMLRRLRLAASLSQEELAERAGLTAKAISALERGERRRPYPNTVRAIGRALDLDDVELTALANAGRTSSPPEQRGEPDTSSPPIPIPPTRLIGRDRELDEVCALLVENSARLVTLTGPGGVGKTRLGWEVASAISRRGWTTVPIELAPIRHIDMVLPAIARGFGVRAGSDDLIERVASVIGESERLLVLDNVEHVVDAAPLVADLIARCPGLRVLATSRAPLRIRAEQEYPVRPLAIPTTGDIGAVLAAPAGRLFVERASAAAPDLVLDPEATESIAIICQRLDGLPLAIELAAAHARYVPPSRLIDRLDQSLADDRLRDLPERQRTMRATLDWSLELCTDDERSLLGTISVFAGGFDRTAVDSVAEPAISDPQSSLDGLVEQSLVLTSGTNPAGDPRYRLLEPIRTHVAGAVGSGSADGVAQRHADHFVDLCSWALTGLRGPDQQGWLDLLALEHANVAIALGFLTSTHQTHEATAAAAGIIAHIWPYWALRGHAEEGRRWIARVLDAPEFDKIGPAARASGLVGSAGLHLATGDSASVLADARVAAELGRAIGDDRLLAESLVLLASGLLFEGDLDGAAAAAAELDAVAEPLANGWLMAHALVTRCQLRIMRGELAAASELVPEAEALARSDAGPFTLATALNVGATLAALQGDDDLALERLTGAAAIAAEVGTTWTLVYTLPGLAGLALRRGDVNLAAVLFAAGAATAERSMLTVSFGPDADAAAAQLVAVRRRLTPGDFEHAWQRGRDIEPDQVVGLLEGLTRGPL